MSTTQKIIRAAADSGGWTLTDVSPWTDIFERKFVLDPNTALGRMFAASKHEPRQRILVGYGGEATALRLLRVYRWTAGQQSMNTGDFVGAGEAAKGRNKAATALEWLA